MQEIPTTATIAVIGAGTMGAGIAQVAAHAGHPVLLFDAAEGAVKKGLARTAKGLDRQVTRGKMSADERDALLSRIRPAESLEALAPAALVVEAIVENLEVKREVLGKLEAICSENTLLATNTSSISITAIGASLKRPQNLLGMHFFNPAPVMKLVEVVSGLATAPEAAEIVYATATAWGKQPVQAGSTPGFIVNRVARPFYAEGLRVLQEGGADVASIDAIMREAGGFRMGPFELMDLIGNDVNFAVTRSVFEAYFNDPRFLPSLIQQELVAAGRLGRKSGHGFYDYSEGAVPPEPVTAEQSSPPGGIIICGDLGPAQPLLDLIETAGLTMQRKEGEGYIQVGKARLQLTDGATATERAADKGQDGLVLFDLALDYKQASRITLAPADRTSKGALAAAAGLFQALDKKVTVIDDLPGMILMRTVCMLANEGADAVNQQVCSADAVDIAMQAGVNYPRGPLAWAEEIGLAYVLEVLDNLARTYGEDRYRASPLLRRLVKGERGFERS